MQLALAILAATLTRAEIVARFKADPVRMCDGLVHVRADWHCPSDMRREYQLPIAGCAAEVCRALYASQKITPHHFGKPGILITIGDVVTNDSTVASRVVRREDGTRFVRVWVPAPGYADVRKIRMAAVRGWFVAVKDVDPDETTARNAFLDAYPETRLAAEVEDLVAWRTEGVYRRGRTDDDYLALQRRILRPGFATREEVLTFASRLMLYPPYFDVPFCGRYDHLEFRDAVHLAKDDPVVRWVALDKWKRCELPILGGGRGEKLTAVAKAYHDFLIALAGGKAEVEELDRMLDDADLKLKEALP